MSTENFMVPPRDGKTLSPTQVFESGCVESRLRELESLIISILVDEDLKKHAKEYRLKGEPVPVYPHDADAIKERFGPRARKESQRILEAERKACIEARSDYIKATLNLVIRQARLLTNNGTGKIYKKKVPIEGKISPGSDGFMDAFYFEDDSPAGKERYEQICRLRDRLGEFNQYGSYMNAELQGLLEQANKLLNLEVVDADAPQKETA
jgi:hypothetical protein